MVNFKNTALVLVDPYNDFLSRRGQAWMMLRNVALSNGMIGKARSILAHRASPVIVNSIIGGPQFPGYGAAVNGWTLPSVAVSILPFQI